jgi:protein TonB
MFANLIESQSHGKEFKRRGRFVLATAAAYTVLFFVAGIVSIYAYDARLEMQTNELEVLSWVPPVMPVDHIRPAVRRASAPTNNRISAQPMRPILYESASNPLKPPDQISAAPNPIPPAPPNAIIGSHVSDSAVAPNSSSCVTCTGNDISPVARVVETTPPPTPRPLKPPTQKLPSTVLASKAISLPQPPYPPLARQIGVHGAVQVQILVDETGRVISAHAVSGHPFLNPSAEQAAQRARFTPTILNGTAVKVQGVITYNFVLQ